MENSASPSPTVIRAPDRLARSESLYRLSYPGELIPENIHWYIEAINTANASQSAIRRTAQMLHVVIAKHIPKAARKPHQVHLIHATDLACYKRIKAIERYRPQSPSHAGNLTSCQQTFGSYMVMKW